MHLMDLELAHSAACRLHRLQVLRPRSTSRLGEPPAAVPTASRPAERYRVEPKRTYFLDPNPQQIARLLQEKRTSNKVHQRPQLLGPQPADLAPTELLLWQGVEGSPQHFNQAEGELLFTREKLSIDKIRQYDSARVEQRAQVKGLQSWQQLEAVFESNSGIFFATSTALLLKQLARLSARNFRRMRRGEDPKASLHVPRKFIHRYADHW